MAWIGVRWRIRTRTFAHVYAPDPERHPIYARQVTGGEAPVVMTFRVPTDDLLGLTASGFPFVRAAWGRNVVVAFLGDHTDWAEIAELIRTFTSRTEPRLVVACHRLVGLAATARSLGVQPCRSALRY